MAENPLLPHQKLNELYALMKQVQVAICEKKQVRGLEAVFAATLLQMDRGDVFCALSSERAKTLFPAKPSRDSIASQLLSMALKDGDLPHLSSLIAFGIKGKRKKNVAVSITATATQVDWPTVLTQAQRERLPFVFLIAETSGSEKDSTSLAWSTLSKHAKAAAIPTITVDGEDAVALYRVVQESLHRARLGDGPTVVWAAIPPKSPRAKGSSAIVTMERYLAVRGLLKQAAARKRSS